MIRDVQPTHEYSLNMVAYKKIEITSRVGMQDMRMMVNIYKMKNACFIKNVILQFRK